MKSQKIIFINIVIIFIILFSIIIPIASAVEDVYYDITTTKVENSTVTSSNNKITLQNDAGEVIQKAKANDTVCVMMGVSMYYNKIGFKVYNSQKEDITSQVNATESSFIMPDFPVIVEGIYTPKVYTLQSGDAQIYDGKSLSFEIAGDSQTIVKYVQIKKVTDDVSKFNNIYAKDLTRVLGKNNPDGVKNYTIITLKPEYIQTLDVSTYSLRFTFYNGNAPIDTTFTIPNRKAINITLKTIDDKIVKEETTYNKVVNENVNISDLTGVLGYNVKNIKVINKDQNDEIINNDLVKFDTEKGNFIMPDFNIQVIALLEAKEYQIKVIHDEYELPLLDDKLISVQVNLPVGVKKEEINAVYIDNKKLIEGTHYSNNYYFNDILPIVFENSYINNLTSNKKHIVKIEFTNNTLASVEFYLKKNLNIIDINDNKWFSSAVQYCMSNGIFNGYSDGTFRPNDKLTRAMLVTVLYNIEGSPKSVQKIDFDDVKDGKWYTEAIKWAKENKLVYGYSDGNRFGPDDVILRQDCAVILKRFIEYKKLNTEKMVELNEFKDSHLISKYAENSMKWAVGSGIIKGSDIDKILNPKDNTTRAEAAVMMQRICENVLNK